jgi:hypothetical protein
MLASGRVATAAAALAIALVAACSGQDSISCTVTHGQASSKISFELADGTKSVATLDGYTVAFEITEGGNGLRADLKNPDQSTLLTVKTTSTAGRGFVGTPDGVLAFECGR